MLRYAKLIAPAAVLGLVLFPLVLLATRASAQDAAKIEVVPQIGHSTAVVSVAFSPDGTRVLSGSFGFVKLWDVASGRLVRTFGGTLTLWDTASGAQLVTLKGGRDDQWLAMTPAGFFAGSAKDAAMLGIVRGFEVYSVAHFYDHLYRPDLVEALLQGDPEGKYADAAFKLSLQKILDSGPAPQIEPIAGRKAERIGDTITIALRLVDTCESEGAARSVATARETAVERLRHATGRSVIAAASTAAYEGYKGHGLLTWAIRDAFMRRESSGDEFVELLELAAHIDREVPVISQKWLGVVQRPHHKIEGNFPLGVRLAKLPGADHTEEIPKTATHILNREEPVRERPAADAAVVRTAPRNFAVRVTREAGEWVAVAREGQELGYVPREAVDQLQ